VGEKYEISKSRDPIRIVQGEVARAARSQEDLSVVLLRVRREKNGHRLRRRIGEQVSRSIRLSDTACWYDTDHVALLLPDTSADGAKMLVTRLKGISAVRALLPDIRIIQYPETSDVIEHIESIARVGS